MITKSQLGDFDSISIFSEDYIKVERDGLYNLIDKDGHFVSNNWFLSIKKNEGGGADFIKDDKSKKVQVSNVTMLPMYENIHSLISNADIFGMMDMRDVIPVSPYRFRGTELIIVAKVNFLGHSLLLGDNGKLYYDNGNEFIVPHFFISMTDINRLNELANKFNINFVGDYAPATHTPTTTALWIFGFGSENHEFNTYNTINGNGKNLIDTTTTKKWGEDTIKVRFNVSVLPESLRENFAETIFDMNFKEWKREYCGNDVVWYTKLYKLEELPELFNEVNSLMNKQDFL